MAKKQFFSKEQLGEIKSQAMAFWEESTNKMRPFFEKVNDYNRLYRVKLPEELENEMKKHPDRSSMVPPDIYNNILSFRAGIRKLVFGSKPYGIVTKEGQPNLRTEAIIKAERKLSELIDMSNFAYEADKAVLQASVAGVGCSFTEWQKIYRRQIIRDKGTKRPISFNNQLVAAFPKAKAIDIRRVRIDDKAENYEDVRLVAYHAKVNESDLLKNNRNLDNEMNFDEQELKDSSFHDILYYEYVGDEKLAYDKTVEASYGDNPVELMDFRGIFRIDDEYMDLIVKIANRNVILEVSPNPLPIDGWNLFDFPRIDEELNRMYVMGLIEPAQDVFLEEWLKRNQSLDASNRLTYDMYIADESATADLPSRIPFVPSGIVKVRMAATGANAVSSVFAPIPRTAQYHDTFQHATTCAQEVQQTMRQSDYRQVGSPARKETATAVEALNVAGMNLQEQVVFHLKNSFYEPVWKKYLIMQNFFRGHEQDSITDEYGSPVTIAPGELDFAFAIDIDVSSALERPSMMRRMVESYPMLSQDPMFDAYEIRKGFIWALALPNQDRLLPNPSKKQMDIERENMALMNGVNLPVHPLDDHNAHISKHQEAAMKMANTPNVEMSPEAQMAFDKHIQAHSQYIEKEAPNPEGINIPRANRQEPTTGQLASGVAPKLANTSVGT